MIKNPIYDNYDLLLPSKHDGGYLIVALYDRIKAGEIGEYFTQREVNEVLRDISLAFDLENVRNWNNIKEKLFHYYLRNDPDDPGKYYLTDYAQQVVEMIKGRLENPFKSHPLKKSFEESFTIRYIDIKTADELQRKFGRLFIQGPKKVITDHLEALDDELREAYAELRNILQHGNEKTATVLVKEFALVFRKFGDRAEDITGAIISKDIFLAQLQDFVNVLYRQMEEDGLHDASNIAKSKADWESAREIYTDLRDFFDSVDRKIQVIRRRINHGSGKLTELQEQFSARAHFRLQIKRLHDLALQGAVYAEEGISFTNGFPLKQLVCEPVRIRYPKYHDFMPPLPNIVLELVRNENYEFATKAAIWQDINRQEIINQWVENAKTILERDGQLSIDGMMDTAVKEGLDLSIAYQIASRMTAHCSENKNLMVDIVQRVITVQDYNLSLWKTTIRK